MSNSPTTPELGQDPISIALGSISPSPENDLLYRPVDPKDPTIIALADSINKNGVLQPLILTNDLYIISGHRRFAAARIAQVGSVPCQIRGDVNYKAQPDLFMHLLREANLQRVKSIDEQLREAVVSASPNEAYAALVSHRQERAVTDFKKIDLGRVKKRAAISEAKTAFVNAIVSVLNDRKKFWPLSVRQIHYALLNSPPLIHSSKPASRYVNDRNSYKSLVELATRLRLDGTIPFNVIADETRPVINWDVHRSAASFIDQEINGLLKGYWRDLLQSQPNQIELSFEKNTLLGILRPVAAQYTIPVTSGRGHCSLPPRRAMAERFLKSGKENLIVLIISDFDPDGETIAQSFARSMRDDFDMPVKAMKVALTADQVKRHNLPAGEVAKAGCSTRSKFVETYGENVFEVEALDPETLQDIVRDAIDSVLDTDAFNGELDREKNDAVDMENMRRKLQAAMGGGI